MPVIQLSYGNWNTFTITRFKYNWRCIKRMELETMICLIRTTSKIHFLNKMSPKYYAKLIRSIKWLSGNNSFKKLVVSQLCKRRKVIKNALRKFCLYLFSDQQEHFLINKWTKPGQNILLFIVEKYYFTRRNKKCEYNSNLLPPFHFANAIRYIYVRYHDIKIASNR